MRTVLSGPAVSLFEQVERLGQEFRRWLSGAGCQHVQALAGGGLCGRRCRNRGQGRDFHRSAYRLPRICRCHVGPARRQPDWIARATRPRNQKNASARRTCSRWQQYHPPKCKKALPASRSRSCRATVHRDYVPLASISTSWVLADRARWRSSIVDRRLSSGRVPGRSDRWSSCSHYRARHDLSPRSSWRTRSASHHAHNRRRTRPE